MKEIGLHIIASVLVLAGLVLIVTGLGGPAVLWRIGLGLIAVAMLFSFATRWASPSDGEGDISREKS